MLSQTRRPEEERDRHSIRGWCETIPDSGFIIAGDVLMFGKFGRK